MIGTHDPVKTKYQRAQLRALLESLAQMKKERENLRSHLEREQHAQIGLGIKKLDLEERINELKMVNAKKKAKNDDIMKQIGEMKKNGERYQVMLKDQRQRKKETEETIERYKSEIDLLKSGIKGAKNDAVLFEREHLETMKICSSKAADINKRLEQLGQDRAILVKNRAEKRLERELARGQFAEILVQMKEVCPDLPKKHVEEMIGIFEKNAKSMNALVNQLAMAHEISYENKVAMTDQIADIENELEGQAELATELIEQYNGVVACVNKPFALPTDRENDKATEESMSGDENMELATEPGSDEYVPDSDSYSEGSGEL